MTRALTETGEKKPVKQIMAEKLENKIRIRRFKGATLIEEEGRWEDLSSDRFAEVCYTMFGMGLNKTRINDLEHLFRTSSKDMSHMDCYISFGSQVWDMKKLDWTEAVAAEDCIYRVHFDVPEGELAQKKLVRKDGRLHFLMDLACHDEGVYDDIMQSVAPLIMHKKPTGVIWYLGGGANGKSTLVHLLYKIFGPYLTEITVKQLEDERDTPQLNGKLGNVCKESSEGFVEDTRTYKSIGTHESFSVHKFHSQDMVEIEGNVHHIFSANNIPTFGDKSYGARRRTLVVPFNNSFKPDETFEERTFTPQFVEAFLGEVIKYAKMLKNDQNYEYKFSDTTMGMKEKYDTEANTAQTYADDLVQNDILGFRNFRLLEQDYQNWCQETGFKPSSINILRRAMDEKEFARRSARDENGRAIKIYLKGDSSYPDLRPVDLRLGLFQIGDSEHRVETLEDDEQEALLKDWSEPNVREIDDGDPLKDF